MKIDKFISSAEGFLIRVYFICRLLLLCKISHGKEKSSEKCCGNVFWPILALLQLTVNRQRIIFILGFIIMDILLCRNTISHFNSQQVYTQTERISRFTKAFLQYFLYTKPNIQQLLFGVRKSWRHGMTPHSRTRHYTKAQYKITLLFCKRHCPLTKHTFFTCILHFNFLSKHTPRNVVINVTV